MNQHDRYRIAVLVSGRGSNLQALINSIAQGTLNAEVVAVFTDNPGALALERAREAQVPGYTFDPKSFTSRGEYDRALFKAIDQHSPELVVCAGYMRLIDKSTVDAHRGRIVNIHPSLLPSFKGLHTHAQALAARETRHGASMHFVTAELDGGPVISQAVVPVFLGDTPDTLATRVLQREHPLLIETLRWLSQGRITLSEDTVHLDGSPQMTPLQLGANNCFA